MDYTNNQLDAISDIYIEDHLYSMEQKLFKEHYARMIAEKYYNKKKSCLDLGLGHGVVAATLSTAFEDYTIVEGSQMIIDDFKARNQEANAIIIQSFFEEYETDKRYDVIVMGFILEHVDSPLEILNKYKFLLNDGGVIYIALPNFAQLNRRIGQLMGIVKTLDFFTDNDIKHGHKHLFDVDSFKSLISSANLKLLYLEGIYMKPITTAQIKQLGLGEDFLKALIAMGKDYPELSAVMFAAVTK